MHSRRLGPVWASKMVQSPSENDIKCSLSPALWLMHIVGDLFENDQHQRGASTSQLRPKTEDSVVCRYWPRSSGHSARKMM